MIYEKSCGAIVNRVRDGERQFLIIKDSHGGHWSFPKGHVEDGETEVQTAVREILEETGLEATIDTKFRRVISYVPRFGTVKDVVLFSATANNALPVPQPSEVDKVRWLSEREAFKRITFKNYRKALGECITYLSKKSSH